MDRGPMAEGDELNWLKKRYREAQDDLIPACKIPGHHQELQAEFPDRHLNCKTVSDIIKQAFPLSETARKGKKGATHIVGIEPLECTDEESSSHPLDIEKGLRDKNQKLREYVRALEQTINGMQQGLSPTHLTQELKTLTSTSIAIHYEPDTTDHFTQFTMDAIQFECQEHAPEVFELLKTLGDVDHHDSEADKHQAEEVTMALASLVKSRAVKV